MDALEAIKRRRSNRTFRLEPVPRQILEELVDSARLAPTARNLQLWEFVIVTKKEVLKELGSFIENGKFISESDCCIAVVSKDTKYYLEDGCAATENILIAASNFGLSACWVAGDKKPYCDKVKEMLGVPSEFKLISLIPLGYSDTVPSMPDKRPLKQLLHWEKFIRY